MTNPNVPTTEPTPEGEQVLVPGVAPITSFDRLKFRVVAPMAPKRNPDAAQKPCDIGLFDLDARDQCDLIEFLRTAECSEPNSDQTRKD